MAQADVTVVVDMSPEGREVGHPSSQAPAYYLPVMRGYQDYGPAQKELYLPTAHDIVHAVAPELAKEGYLATGDPAQASLIIDISWGRIGPTDIPSDYNQHLRYALSLGKTAFNVMTPESFGHDEFMEATEEERYFIIVTAYDLRAWERRHEHVILWKAKMGIPISGVLFPDVVSALAKAGGLHFGRETVNHPSLVADPTLPDGHIDIGATEERK